MDGLQAAPDSSSTSVPHLLLCRAPPTLGNHSLPPATSAIHTSFHHPTQTMSLYSTLAGAIDAYTGLSPAAFFTVLALMVGVYRLVCGLFVSPDAAEEHQKRSLPPDAFVPPPEPVQLGDITLEELRMYDGSDPKKPLLMSIKGHVYDVSMSRMFYGPGGPYALFAGRDASRALALMSFDPNDLTSDIEGLSSSEVEVLQDWEYKFMEKYVKVGQIVTENAKNGVAEKADTGEVDQEQKPVMEDVSEKQKDKGVATEAEAI